ncbi:2-keto-4-pentenoate hydratase/2-oxohepta-3-ene-1,7-dioic acid hydratase in catechol pathway [Peribacillus deserti]|uniref:2-keto-4-pentenoate hydratase/2-oxohepta-3-ene-1,7-dioic acid hydratase in catechol pathway n=1 Tax=Peribacillus deserti TaxID=673318 RepID=A0ABS2QF84_9BACI|nr:fumarylacetoacetate hydrolase family protein [Peribacillus deserti]MBM7691695.1 2-keto-4-pentenoate hydratase/2-oxohepta-3-ene-1,7-dioic acid hydratase in catechol pathway [Peribacillus deserti]
MRLATIVTNGTEKAAVITKSGAVLIDFINQQFKQNFETTLFEIIRKDQLNSLKEWYETEGSQELEQSAQIISKEQIEYAPLYKHPRKIWGIGLNYVEHASDLSEKAPNTEPASFMKPDTAIIGFNDTIEVPLQSERTTAEAELGIIIGKECKDISEEDAPNVVAGLTTIIDMTAEDILQKNPRYLTRSKSFDTFFSFGPELVTLDEIKDILNLNVATVINGNIHRENVVANMTFRPWQLVSFHSKVMTLLPGDIISTGTPGAVVIRDGDIVECQIEGFETLVNKVQDLKVKHNKDQEEPVASKK